jgi:hypothetical protein
MPSNRAVEKINFFVRPPPHASPIQLRITLTLIPLLFFLKSCNRMNYAEYMRKQERNRQKIITTKFGRDASDVTLKNQAIATSVTHRSYFDAMNSNTNLPLPFVTQISPSSSDPFQNTDSAASLIGFLGSSNAGVVGFAGGRSNVDTANSLIQSAQFAAYSNVYGPSGSIPVTTTVIPCSLSTIVTSQASTLGIIPGQPKILRTSGPGFPSPGIIFTNPKELIADQGRQASIRTSYNLPSKLNSLRGPIVNSM